MYAQVQLPYYNVTLLQSWPVVISECSENDGQPLHRFCSNLPPAATEFVLLWFKNRKCNIKSALSFIIILLYYIVTNKKIRRRRRRNKTPYGVFHDSRRAHTRRSGQVVKNVYISRTHTHTHPPKIHTNLMRTIIVCPAVRRLDVCVHGWGGIGISARIITTHSGVSRRIDKSPNPVRNSSQGWKSRVHGTRGLNHPPTPWRTPV